MRIDSFRPAALAWALTAALVVAPCDAVAQSRTTSAVRGFVTGRDGAAVVGAQVTVRHEQTGATRTGLTNAQGAFLVLLLQPGGPYTVTVEHLGFAEHRTEGLILQVGETFPVEITLETQAVELSGIDVEVDRATIFNPGQIGPATRLTERILEATPILSRDVMQLAVLSPLVKTIEGGGFSVAGQNDRYNAILVDGLVSKDMFGLTAGGVPGGQAGAKLIPIDAVSQYEVLVAPFDVRLSGFTGGVMNAVTRSGTNDWRVRVAGVHRAEALMGDLSLPTGPVDASGVDRSLLAFSVGGPLVPDRGHFYVAGEFEERHQPPAGFNLFRDPASLVRISEASMGAFESLFSQRHAVDVGDAGAYPLGHTLANLFARSDWSFANGNRLTLRNVFAHASNDEAPNRSAFLPYELSSNAVFRSSTNNISSLQLFSQIAGAANELDVTVQRTTDRTTPAVDWPQVEVDLASSVGGTGLRRAVRVGGQFFAQENALDQTSVRVTNSFDIERGDDLLTLGITGSYYDIAHTFLPGAAGEYYFPSFGDLQINAPHRYQRTVLAEGQDRAASFGVLEWGAFVQHLLNAGKGLTMRFGLRLDVPHVTGKPGRNFEVLDYFGYDTAVLPSGNPLLSPRFGFNWQSDGVRTTQVRGGFGWFSGQVPYVWLSNAFHNDGLRSVTLACEGRWNLEPRPQRPAPLLDLSAPPTSCYNPNPAGPQPAFRELRSVVVFEEGFKYPQDLKFSAAVDHELTDRVSGSVGFLFSKALNQVGLRELNVEGGNTSLASLGGTERRYYDRTNPALEQVLLVTNEGEDWGASLSAELRGRLGERLGFQLAYALARSWDRMSLVFTDMHSNFGLNPTEFDVNDPPLRTSNFDRPHKIVATLYGAPFAGLPNTEISVLYTGQSGPPFSYVYGGDVNGDGYPGIGGALDRFNDLIHIPAQPSRAPLSLVTQILMSDAIQRQGCLRERQGGLARRNSCRAPWENRLDLRVAHTLRWGGRDVRFEGDLINVLNLVSSDLGKIQTTRPIVPLLDLCELGCTDVLPATWGGAVLPARGEDGSLRSADPWNVVSPDSQWQMQLGVRMTLGGRR